MNAGAGIAVTIALLGANAFFVAAEFALVATRRSQVELRAEAGSRRAVTTLRSMEQLSLMLAGAQLGVTVCSLALGAVSEPVLAHLLEPVFHAAHLPASAGHPISFAIALIVVTGLHVVLGEMVPKNATLAAPESSALWLAPVLAAVVRMLRPFIWLLNAASNATVRLLRVTPRSEVASTVTSDELVGVVTQSHREGLLPAEDLGLLANAISFETATAGDLAIPLEQVHTLPPGASADAVEERAAATGATRLPVRDDSAQPVLTGYIHLRDVLAVPVGQRDEPLPVSVIRDLPAMSETLPLADAVELFRARRTHIARVHPAGAAGVTAGVITLDDILVSLVQD